MKTKKTGWPVLKKYDAAHLAKIAMPVGGIGTGTISLGGRGDLRAWEIMDRPSKNFVPPYSFFSVYAKSNGVSEARLLEGPLDDSCFEGASGARTENHGFPRFKNCSFYAAYPLAQVLLDDPGFPLSARIEAFNPLVPCDAESSGIPVAAFRFVLQNRTAKRVDAAVCGCMNNFTGGPDKKDVESAKTNKFRKDGNISGIYMFSKGLDPDSDQYGTMALSAIANSGVSFKTAWKGDAPWGENKLDFWEDFSADGILENKRYKPESPQGSLAVKFSIAPRSEKSVIFLITWHFPNRQTWTPRKLKNGKPARDNNIGNYYATLYKDAWDVAVNTAANLPALEKKTVAFVKKFCESSLPETVKEAALFNLSTLRSQTCFRTPDGRFYAWEGCCDGGGCCLGSCTHVWNYEQATAFLFGDLALTMRDVEFNHATHENGKMSFRVFLPLKRAKDFQHAAADGQMGCLMKLYRDWQLSGDDKMLKKAWPHARKALEFCWIKGGWDADCDGVMEGCQHNTMDVEYYGPNPQMQSWYLGALRAMEEMAKYLGESGFAEKCRKLFAHGSKWTDDNLFNGEYYEHKIQPPGRADKIADGLCANMGTKNFKNPEYQLGSGCLIDQLVGQYMAHICGLGYLLKRANVKKTLKSILKYNSRAEFYSHFNSLRSFALNDEKALLMASYPLDRRPEIPFPYFTEVMTGFEYTAAVGMIQEGMLKEGLGCMANIRARYDGRRRSPFNEAECGHHYGRAMASWAAVTALSGFHYSAVDRSIGFTENPGVYFWSTGHAWGQCVIKKRNARYSVVFSVESGKISIREFRLGTKHRHCKEKPVELSAGQRLNL